MNHNPGYYNQLLQYSKTVPCPSENQIKLDLKRTFPEEKSCMKDIFLEKLKNILICYSIRNSSIGYCQGFNFIAERLLYVLKDEVKIFILILK